MGFSVIPTYSDAYLRRSVQSDGGTPSGDSVLAVESILGYPPTSPIIGNYYLIHIGATGSWAGHDNEITEWIGSSWDYSTPKIGKYIYVKDEDRFYYWSGTTWKMPDATNHDHDDRYYTKAQTDNFLDTKQDEAVDTSNFNHILDATDNTVQKCLDSIDDSIQWDIDLESYKIKDKSDI